MNIRILTLAVVSALTIICCMYLKGYSSKPNKEQVIAGIMNYPMEHMTKRCQKDFHYTDEDMVILERELKRYLILCALNGTTERIGMYSHDVDNLWHSFILFTKEYAQFGHKYAGHFIHHRPETGDSSPSKEKAQAFYTFIENYEKTFHEEADAIWFLDMVEKSQEAL
jgi:hypothetical protein